MRIWWQSFVDTAQNAPYLERLSEYLSEIADAGTSVDVHGMAPGDRHFGRIAEFRCAAQAIDNALDASPRATTRSSWVTSKTRGSTRRAPRSGFPS